MSHPLFSRVDPFLQGEQGSPFVVAAGFLDSPRNPCADSCQMPPIAPFTGSDQLVERHQMSGCGVEVETPSAGRWMICSAIGWRLYHFPMMEFASQGHYGLQIVIQ